MKTNYPLVGSFLIGVGLGGLGYLNGLLGWIFGMVASLGIITYVETRK